MSDEETWTLADEEHAEIFDEIWRVLLVSYTEFGASLWLNCRNRWLGEARPIDLINAGDGARVREAAYSIEGGPL